MHQVQELKHSYDLEHASANEPTTDSILTTISSQSRITTVIIATTLHQHSRP